MIKLKPIIKIISYIFYLLFIYYLFNIFYHEFFKINCSFKIINIHFFHFCDSSQLKNIISGL